MEAEMVDQYWCHMCSQMVNPATEAHIKCPFCDSGFLEEMGSTREVNNSGFALGSEHVFSLWDTILLDLTDGLGTSGLRSTAQEHISSPSSPYEDDELDFESLPRRRGRRSSSSVQSLLQDLNLGAENYENDRESTGSSSSILILVNPSNEEAIILQSPEDMNQAENPSQNVSSSFREYLIGPGVDLLLHHHLAESGPNRYGTPPANKEAVKAMPTVSINQNLQCSICLEEFEIGSEAKEMPCKHKFHGECIAPWLELHSSCPVCRFLMPSDDSKTEVRSQIGGSSISSPSSTTMPGSTSYTDET
uniref:RING-type E3 ubiquitin transferase n=1 Tax=Populus alba TaxID=43335 RepID=A0A4U5QX12_POPAL|nr:E3 ubiquitin-protein ligase RING1-like isoform X2 [Populus alba]